MFERYTEKARRVIFFARYEASQFGSPSIETEHLLLGLLREDTALAGRMARSPLSPRDVRKRIEEELPHGAWISTSIDMPLSAAAKAVLAAAAEEAESLGNNHVETGHILLGILRQEQTLAAKLLSEAGVVLSKDREDLRHTEHHPGRPAKPIPELSEDYIEIHGESWSAGFVRKRSDYYQQFHWERRRWAARDALVERSNRKLHLYTGQSYNPEQFEFVKDGWSEDHCVICWWKLRGMDSLERGEGYTNGQDWLCTVCYDRLVRPKRPAD
jgi:hypothetical protein